MAKDYYTILAVPQNATPQQIRARFLELARSRHPDLFMGEEKVKAESEFQSITEAFNVLSHPERRRQHDIELTMPGVQQQTSDPKQMIRVFLQRGAKAYRDENYLEAAENYDRVTKLDEKHASAWYHLALACSHDRRWHSRGMSAITKACELDKMNGGYYKLAGRLFAEGGMPLRAERYYRHAQRWLGEDPEIKEAIAELKKRK